MYYKRLLLLSVLLICLSNVNSNKDCVNEEECAENEIKDFIKEIDREGKVNLFGDYLVIEKTGNDVSSRMNRNLDESIASFVDNHVLKLKLPTEDGFVKTLEESRGSKLKKIILPLILLLKLKAAVIIPAVLSAIALIAFKGLGASIVAITLAGATALKSLLDNHHVSPKVTYEVVPQLSHWSRSSMDGGIESYPLPGYHTIL